MNKTIISINEINPFIRYAGFVSFPNMFSMELLAYDCKLMYVYSGSGHIKIDDTAYNAIRGCLFIWNPSIKYHVILDEGCKLNIISINFDYTWKNSSITTPLKPYPSNKFMPDKVHELCEFSDNAVLNKPVYLQNMQDEEKTLLKIIDEYRFKKTEYILRTRILFLSFISKISRLASIGNFTNETNDKIAMIIDYIHENYKKQLTNTSISEYFNFHPIYINRLMVRYTGYSMHQYLLNHRIHKALNLLHTTGKSVSEIAYEVGYSNTSNFSKYFKKLIGVSPKTYLNNTMIISQ